MLIATQGFSDPRTPSFRSARDVRRVWILGAGFSRPLGGPLLTDLLSDSAADHVRARFPETSKFLDAPDARKVYELYHLGLRGRQGRPDGATRSRSHFASGTPQFVWEDAETFLTFLGTGAEAPESTPARRIHRMMNRENEDLGALDAMAKRIVAAECSAFLDAAEDLNAERWSPYVRWARSLTPNDTIVTFNYDLVPEMLARTTNVNLHIVDDEDEGAVPAAATIVLKVHGSVSWNLETTNGRRRFAAPPPLARHVFEDGNLVPAIGVPGPGKQFASKGEFAFLWRKAVRAIEKAHDIWFVGYRFPETDAFSRAKILGALTPELQRHAYLALGSANSEARRLERLLQGRVAHAWNLELFAQDVLDKFAPSPRTSSWGATT